VSGKKRITVDEATWNDAMRKASQLRQVQRDLPEMLEKVKQASEQQAARDRAELQAGQDELSSKLESLSSYAQQIEATTTQRITTVAAAIMSEARRADENLRADTRQLMERQEQRFTVALNAESDERKRDFVRLQRELDKERAARADVLAIARTMVADARILHDAIESTLPHERYAPRKLAKLTSLLAMAEANIAGGIGEAGLATAQGLLLDLTELRSEVQLRDVEWRAAHLTAVTIVTALIQQISASEHIDLVNDELGLSADLDVDFWSAGELSKIGAQADQLSARLADEANPPTLADLADISQRTVASLDKDLSEAVALAQARQWASQIRVNMAAQVIEILERTTPYDLDGEPIFAGDDQRAAFYAKLRSPDDSEIVVEVAPGKSGESCAIRVLSYDAGTPSEHLRAARAQTIAEALSPEGASGAPAAEPGEPEPVYRDLTRLRQSRATSAASGSA
jgi:hypothetical protein